MKTQGIGDISRGGGFTRFIRDIQDTQEPAIIMRNNEPVAVTFPLQSNMVRFVEAFQSFLNIVRTQFENEMADSYELYLMTQLMTGYQAKSLLSRIMTADEMAEIERNVALFTRPLVESILVSSFGKIRLPRLVDVVLNSSEEGGSVPPMTTARAGVSEVKQEGAFDDAPSLSRKSGKKPSKKEASFPQKRKIGTKREKSA